MLIGKKLKWYKSLFYLIYLCVIFNIISCSQTNSSNTISSSNATKEARKKILKSPVTINESVTITLLDTCPKPRMITVPRKPGGSYVIKTENGPKTIELLPPETKPADFYVSMQPIMLKMGFH